MRLATPQATLEKRADGSMLLRSPQKLAPYARCVTEWLVRWSDKAPERGFLAERVASGGWKTVTYRETHGAVRRIRRARDHELGRGVLDGARGAATVTLGSVSTRVARRTRRRVEPGRHPGRGSAKRH